MINTITLLGNPVSVVVLPTKPGFRSCEWYAIDTVATNVSPFTRQTQAQKWLGADSWQVTLTLPSLTQAQADDWVSALMEMRGMSNACQIGNPFKLHPRGIVAGAPVVDGGTVVAIGSETLYTRGWAANHFRLLLPGDCLQVGFRYHQVLNVVNSDGLGNAAISVWPSLREVPVDSAPLILNNPKGLFRLSTNKRAWSADQTRTTKLSIPLIEYR